MIIEFGSVSNVLEGPTPQIAHHVGGFAVLRREKTACRSRG